MKVPLICSGANGLAELVHDGETGIVTRENTPDEIAAAIQKLADDKNLRQQLIDNAYRFCERFNIDEHIKKIEQIYEQILSSG
jgi:glycosyltransferase involved in cell wall biosynthesis